MYHIITAEECLLSNRLSHLPTVRSRFISPKYFVCLSQDTSVCEGRTKVWDIALAPTGARDFPTGWLKPFPAVTLCHLVPPCSCISQAALPGGAKPSCPVQLRVPKGKTLLLQLSKFIVCFCGIFKSISW